MIVNYSYGLYEADDLKDKCDRNWEPYMPPRKRYVPPEFVPRESKVVYGQFSDPAADTNLWKYRNVSNIPRSYAPKRNKGFELLMKAIMGEL